MSHTVTAVSSEPVSLAEARLQIKAGTDTSEDALLVTWIAAARETAEGYVDRAITLQTVEDALDAFPCGAIELEVFPATEITSIKYLDTDGVEQTLATNQYALSTYGRSRTVNLTYGNSWPSTRSQPDAVKVLYAAGPATAPKVAKAAVLLMVAWLNEHRGDEMDPNDIQPPAAKALLGPLKIYGF